MGIILHFPDRRAQQLLDLSLQLDAAIECGMDTGLETWELTGVVANALGRLLKAVGDHRQIDYCLDIVADALNKADEPAKLGD